MRIFPFLVLAVLLAGASAASANLLKQVTAGQQSELAAGEIVVKSTNVQGSVWPQLSLYKVVNAPPKAVSDLFGDYEAGPSYIPGMLGAKVLSTNPDGSKDVQYTVRVPILQRISYTVRDTYEQKGDTYSVSWVLLHSPLAKSGSGSLKIQPYGKNQTLMCYTNLVVPITSLVAGLKNQALTEAKSTVQAIADEAERRAKQGNLQ